MLKYPFRKFEVEYLFFDLCNTLFDASTAKQEDLEHYGDVLRSYRERKKWVPFAVPESLQEIKPFLNTKSGINHLRETGYKCIILSNFPAHISLDMLAREEITVDGIVPLEACKTYKPDFKAYWNAIRLWNTTPDNFGMVTANKHFGDLEAAEILGMVPLLIHDDPDNGQPKFETLMHLAEYLER